MIFIIKIINKTYNHMKKRIRLTESKEITKPEDIYTVLSKGLFDRAIVVQGNGDKYEVINVGKIRGDGSEWMICKDKDGSTHTWYYTYYDDIKRGSIKSITVIQESRNMNKKVIRLTESDLRHMISESVRRVLNEGDAEDYEMDCLRSEKWGNSDEYNPYDALTQIYDDIDGTMKYFAKKYNDDDIELSFKAILEDIRHCLLKIGEHFY
jgi:DNA primase large subunit